MEDTQSCICPPAEEAPESDPTWAGPNTPDNLPLARQAGIQEQQEAGVGATQ